MSDAALREVLRSPLDQPPPARRGLWALLAIVALATAGGFGAAFGVRTLVDREAGPPATTTTSTTLATAPPPSPVAGSTVGLEALAAWRQGPWLYVAVAGTVLPGADPAEVAAIPSAHWVLRLGNGTVLPAAGELVTPLAPGMFTLQFPVVDLNDGAELLAYPAEGVREETVFIALDSGQLPWEPAADATGYELGGERLVLDRVRLDDAGGEVLWHLAGDSVQRAVVSAAATYSEVGGQPQAIVAEADLPFASLEISATAAGATRSGGISLFHLDDAEQPTFRSRFWGDPERIVDIEQLRLTLTVQLYDYGDDALVLPLDLPVSGDAEAAPPPTTMSTSTTTPSDGAQALAAFVDDLVQGEEFSGVVLVARGEDVLWQAAAGWADRAAERLILPDTKFNLGSMNKMFTAVAVLQLMEQGLLALDGTIAAYLPDYPNQEVAGQVTIEHLLTHTSGLGNVFTEEFGADPHRYRTNADYLPLFVDAALQFPPGEEFSYSNAGYVVLGLIIERLSGLSYDDYMAAHVFGPAGMLDTGAFDIDEAVPNMAIGYTTQDADGEETGVLRPHTDLMPGRGFAAGGGYSTAGDLLRFRNALFTGRLLSAESVDLLLTGRVEIRPEVQYALGFFDRIEAGRRVVGHGGGAPGVCSSLGMYPETDHTVVVLSNTDQGCLTVLEFLKTRPPG